MQRPAQAKDFQLDGGDASNRRWPAGLVMARQKFGLSRQCERAEETFALQTEAGCPLLARLRHADCTEQCPLLEVTRKTFAQVRRRSSFDSADRNSSNARFPATWAAESD